MDQGFGWAEDQGFPGNTGLETSLMGIHKVFLVLALLKLDVGVPGKPPR